MKCGPVTQTHGRIHPGVAAATGRLDPHGAAPRLRRELSRRDVRDEGLLADVDRERAELRNGPE